MSSGISSKTPRYGFNIVSFDYPRWATFEHENWRLLDSILQAALVSSVGIWRNSQAYTLGMRAIDDTNFKTYAAQSAHTSSATGTFSAERAAFPTRWIEVLNAPTYRGTWAPATAYNYLDVVSLSTGEFYIATTAHTSGGTFSATNWTQTGSAFLTPYLPTDVKLLMATTSNLRLDGVKSATLAIGGVARPVPTTGPTLAVTGLTPGTLYYIYAAWSGSAVFLEASTTGHTRDATTGIEVKTGDASRTLVGMARPIAGPLWQYSGAQRFVRSYYNRTVSNAEILFSGTITSTTMVALTPKAEFLIWADESVDIRAREYCLASVDATAVFLNVGMDGSQVGNETACNPYTVQNLELACWQIVETPAEGYHFAQAYMRVSAANATVSAGHLNTLVLPKGVQ